MRRKNVSGYMDTTDCYRTIHGLRYIGWMACPSKFRLQAYRKAGLRCRRFGEDLFMCELDREKANAVDATLGDT